MKKLELNQMESIEGGVTQADYCSSIIDGYANNNWTGDVFEMFVTMYELYCV